MTELQNGEKNRAKCLKCETIIESKSRHNFVACACGSCFVDGGNDYSRFGYAKDGDIFLMPFDDHDRNKVYNTTYFAVKKENPESQKNLESLDLELAPL
jgi:hypothetical protein